jgi:hypothetical protein
MAAIFAATTAAHRHVYTTSAADCDAYTDGHAGCWQPHPNTNWCAEPDTHIHRYQRTRGHTDTHRHSSGAADGYADAAATTTDRYANTATAATHGYADTAATTADGYTTTTTADGYTTTANRYTATAADQHACSVSDSDPGRWLTQADTLILNRKTSRRF